MLISATKPMFAWEELEDSPLLATVKRVLAAIPDAKLIAALCDWRGKGRDDYPMGVLWRVFLTRIALRPHTTEDCLAELRRNGGLRRLIGIDHESQVPHIWNMSRFEEVLGQEPHVTLMRKAFDQMMRALGEAVPDLGCDTAGDATHLAARATCDRVAKEEIAACLTQPSGGRKEHTDDDGQVTRVIEWDGYKLHLLGDVKHEVLSCPMAEICSAGQKYGKTVRVPHEEDLRRFPAIPRATKQFERHYKGRTSIERINAS